MLYAKRTGLDRRAFSHLDPWEWHHFYLGLILWGGASLACWVPLQVVGLIVTWDDAFQHGWQALRRTVRYRSPLHRLYEWLFVRVPFVQWLTYLLDDFTTTVARWFGRR